MPLCGQDLRCYILKCSSPLDVGFPNATEASNLNPWRIKQCVNVAEAGIY